MTDAGALDELRRRLEAAENDGDAELIAALMAEDAVIMVPDFEVQEGRAASARFIRDVLPALHQHFRRRIRYASAEIAVHGDVAYDRGTFEFTATPRTGGGTTFAHGKYLWMYSRGPAGSWQLSRLVASLDEDRGQAGPVPSPLRRAMLAVAGLLRRVAAGRR